MSSPAGSYTVSPLLYKLCFVSQVLIFLNKIFEFIRTASFFFFYGSYQLMEKELLHISKVVKVNIWTWRSREGKKNIKTH